MINENEELMPVPADRAVAAFEQCECFAPETKPIVDEVDRSNARVVREILSQTPNAVNIAVKIPQVMRAARFFTPPPQARETIPR